MCKKFQQLLTLPQAARFSSRATVDRSIRVA
jgi:hypothetical protein